MKLKRGFQCEKYKCRVADEFLKHKLEERGAVLIEGPKWCGKTTTAKQIASIILYMDDPERRQQNLAMAELSPKQLLKGATPRLMTNGSWRRNYGTSFVLKSTIAERWFLIF